MWRRAECSGTLAAHLCLHTLQAAIDAAEDSPTWLAQPLLLDSPNGSSIGTLFVSASPTSKHSSPGTSSKALSFPAEAATIPAVHSAQAAALSPSPKHPAGVHAGQVPTLSPARSAKHMAAASTPQTAAPGSRIKALGLAASGASPMRANNSMGFAETLLDRLNIHSPRKEAS